MVKIVFFGYGNSCNILFLKISIENRIKIIQIHHKNGGSVKTAYHKIWDIFGRYNRPSEIAINKFSI